MFDVQGTFGPLPQAEVVFVVQGKGETMAVDQSPVNITGRYAFLPNPCTTEPCIPGMAYAVEAEGRVYFLTVADRWSDQDRSWGAWMPTPGDTVTVTGRVTERRDVYGETYFTIEVESLGPR